MRNWKTTIGGVLLSVGTLLAAGTGAYRLIGTILVMVGGLLVGVSAADAAKK